MDDNSALSYSAYLDDAHDKYAAEARQLRTKRRSGKFPKYEKADSKTDIKTDISRDYNYDYESDITRDGETLLEEFGDSEVFVRSTNEPDKFRPPYANTNANANPTPPILASASTSTSTSTSVSTSVSASVSTSVSTSVSGTNTNKSAHTSTSTSISSDLTDFEQSLLNEMRQIESSAGDGGDVKDVKDMKDVNNAKNLTDIKKDHIGTSTNYTYDYRGARTITKWVNDEMVDNCYGCRGEFSYFNRKHHCRVCGKIFCHTCSRYSTILPMDILSNIPTKPGTYTDMIFGDDLKGKSRVCADCFKYVSNIIRIRKIIKVFEICGFNLIELTYLSTMSEDWKKAADFCIDRFREIQYKLSIENLTSMEKKYIWVNRYLLSRHSRWMVMLFKCCNLQSESHVRDLQAICSNHKKISCWDMRCSRFCSEDIRLGDMLDLVKYNSNNRIISEYIVNCFNKIDGGVLLDYLPFLVTNVSNNIYMIDILLDKFQNDFTLISHLYWCVKTFVQNINIRRNSTIQILQFIKNKKDDVFSRRFKSMIRNERMNMEWVKTQNRTKSQIVIPVCPDRDFDSIDVPNIKIINSNSKPIIIPFVESDKKKLIMYKEDDIRKDYVILGIVNIIHNLLKEEMQDIDIDIVKYRVMPTSERTGYIEIVENAANIYQIIQKETIQNYILNHNEHAKVSDIKDRFIKSTALYCVISYLFGFGDRHLENIMISESGLLFHIDFGYILGQDPKYTNNKYLRVTPEIVNVIGGQDTENYSKFSEICAKIYTCLRKHVNLFSNLLSVIKLVDPTITEELIKSEIFDRFEVGETHLEAAAHMDLKVRRDSGSFDYMIIDFLHRSKNSTLFKGLTYVKDSIISTLYPQNQKMSGMAKLNAMSMAMSMSNTSDSKNAANNLD